MAYSKKELEKMLVHASKHEYSIFPKSRLFWKKQMQKIKTLLKSE